MAGKVSDYTSKRLHRVLDKLSKNTWIELAVDRAKATIGEDSTDDQIIDVLEEWLSPVCRMRGDRLPGLKEQAMRYDRSTRFWGSGS